MPQWQWWMPRRAKCGFAGQGIATPKLPQGAIRQTQFRRKAQNGARCYDLHEEEELFICHIHNYTEYNQQWNVFSAFNQSKCTHTWSSGQPTLRRPGSSWGFGALLKGLTSVVDNTRRSWDSNPQPLVTSPTLYPLESRLPWRWRYVHVISWSVRSQWVLWMATQLEMQ